MSERLRSRSAVVLGVGALFALCALTRAQQAPPRDAALTSARTGSGLIAGTVVDAGSGLPVRRVVVLATDQSGTAIVGGRVSVTDDAGRFTFRNLPAGRYVVAASKAAYLPTAFGVTKPMRAGAPPSGTAINLTEGQRLTDLALRITRGSVVAGTVRGPDGRPVRNASVSLAYATRASLTGDSTLIFLSGGSVNTDTRGEYRIFGVPPGEYVASVRILTFAAGLQGAELEATTDTDLRRVTEPSAPSTSTTPAQPAANASRRPTYGYATVFYPGTTVLSAATPIALGAGDERSGIDFLLQLVPQSRISGVVTGLDGRPAENVAIRLSTAAPSSAGPFVTSTTLGSGPQGQFVMRGVAAGDYVIEVRPGGSGRAGQPAITGWARVPVSVAPGVDMEVNIALQRGRTVTGQISMDAPAAGPPPDFTRARLSLMNRDGLATSSTITADGQFTFTSLVPEAYRFLVSMPAAPGSAPLFLKSATIGGRDALDALADVSEDVKNASVVMTDKMAEVSGAILDGAGHPAPEYVIIIFPADKALWSWQSRRIQQQRPAHDGKFTFRNLPAGEYVLGAVTDVEQNQWYEPAFLSQLLGASSAKFTLGDGEKKTQDIRLR